MFRFKNSLILLAALIVLIVGSYLFAGKTAVALPTASGDVYLPIIPKEEPGPQIAGCNIFPNDNIWNTPIDSLPVHPNSTNYINSIGAGAGLHADFGSGVWPPGSDSPIGIPYVVVDSSQPEVAVSFGYDDESDPGPYPIPPDAPREGGPTTDEGDRHVLVLEKDNCILYELYAAERQPDNSWTAGSGAVYDLNAHALRPAGWTSADAAGLPILPGLVRYDEVASGEIKHAIRFTVQKTQDTYVWPARHQAGQPGTNYPPMGSRLRLKAGFDISSYPPQIQVILQAMKTYGLILADNGSAWYISGVPDSRWDNDMLHTWDNITGSNFEVVDVSSLMIDPDSGQALQP